MANYDDAWQQLQEVAKKYDEWKNKNAILTNPAPKPGRPVGSKTKDKEVIIQETVDRLIDQVVKLLTKHNFDEDRLNDADITVDEKANYAFVTVTVGLPNGSIISVSERVKVANKTDPSKNWNKLNTTAYNNARNATNAIAGGLSIAKAIDDGLGNSYFKNNDK